MASRAQMRAKMQIAAGKGNKVDYSKGFQQKPQQTPQQGNQPGPSNMSVRQANAMSRERRTGQTGALGMLSERLSQGLAKKKKMAGQQNATAQQGIMQQLMSQRRQGQRGQQAPTQVGRSSNSSLNSIVNRQAAPGGMGRFTEPANLQGRQVGGNFTQPMTGQSRRRTNFLE